MSIWYLENIASNYLHFEQKESNLTIKLHIKPSAEFMPPTLKMGNHQWHNYLYQIIQHEDPLVDFDHKLGNVLYSNQYDTKTLYQCWSLCRSASDFKNISLSILHKHFSCQQWKLSALLAEERISNKFFYMDRFLIEQGGKGNLVYYDVWGKILFACKNRKPQISDQDIEKYLTSKQMKILWNNPKQTAFQAI